MTNHATVYITPFALYTSMSPYEHDVCAAVHKSKYRIASHETDVAVSTDIAAAIIVYINGMSNSSLNSPCSPLSLPLANQ